MGKMKLDIIYNEDCLMGMKKLPNESIDLIACDPQYGWSFMGKDWDKAAPSINIWRQCFRVLKPGSFAFIMSGPRLDCLIENGMRIREAGLVISFTPIFWCFAAGFPKAMSISKAVDKRNARLRDEYEALAKYLKSQRKKLGLSQKDIAKRFPSKTGGLTGCVWNWENGANVPTKKEWIDLTELLDLDGRFDELIERAEAEREIIGKHPQPANEIYQSGKLSKDVNMTVSATPQAQALDGSYAGFQPKPALEVIIVAMKPLSEKTYVGQALKNRKGITWLDEGRIPYKQQDWQNRRSREGDSIGTSKFAGSDIGSVNHLEQLNNQGRFPANLLVSDDMLNDGKIRYCPVTKGLTTGGKAFWHKEKPIGYKSGFPDSGSFSRYFSLDSWWEKKIKELPIGVQKTFPFLICAKASKAEKNRGCEKLKDKMPVSENYGTKAHHPLYEDGRPNKVLPTKNYHPTVKPIKLMSYLITLGSCEGDVILDPFIGSGTTAIAAKMLGRNYIGFEINPEYCKIARNRLKNIQLQLFNP